MNKRNPCKIAGQRRDDQKPGPGLAEGWQEGQKPVNYSSQSTSLSLSVASVCRRLTWEIQSGGCQSSILPEQSKMTSEKTSTHLPGPLAPPLSHVPLDTLPCSSSFIKCASGAFAWAGDHEPADATRLLSVSGLLAYLQAISDARALLCSIQLKSMEPPA